MIKPRRILATLSITVGLLLAVVLAFPDGEIRITDSFSLRFFSLNNLLHPGPKEKVDISGILQTEGADTVMAAVDTAIVRDSLNIDVKAITLVKNKIQFATGDNAPLHNFFHALEAVRNSKALIHILHYGDSQLEGDRISSVIRQKFQENEMFSGCGPGLIPVRGTIQGRIGFSQSNSGNWREYEVGGKSDHRHYGLMGSYFMFTPHPAKTTEADSTRKDSVAVAPDSIPASAPTAWFKITRYGAAPGLLQAARRARVLMYSHGHPFELKVSVNGAESATEQITTAGLLERSYPVNGGFNSILVEVTGRQSPEVYGVCLECESGVMVDNIPLRSAMFANFSMMETQALAKQISDFNVSLVILQFGINVVKNESGNYKYYEDIIYNNIMSLMAAAPDVSILVIGLSDMARKEGTGMASYPNIEKIRDAQRNAAFRAGAGFWDLYEAMGGKNSMISWVLNDPPQAEKDYTHFNPAGARVVGKMIYDALMEEYYRYKGVIGG